ncbi:hypothetical protein C8A03DRAFT_43955 [Achaetomium macrosporum]|uniref:Uncharacterized protein n=1 Tax=Achaetomium macrosporum TaxID=79813 RepID=A0AAN7CB36_9PEZI|nr:hypothetical protein C8A03DRAFT_43955 [Achaetomium macrosporum]
MTPNPCVSLTPVMFAFLSYAGILEFKTINFSIRANYTKWEPREAFRELRDFCVIRKEKISGRDTEIVYGVPRVGPDDTNEWLGYIRFRGRDGVGTIDITNRSATLQPWHLDLGGTSKAGDAQQAGAHGEGLKIAPLVLLRGRQNHGVTCRSGGFNWKFNFTTRGRLVARLRRMSPEAIYKAKDQAQRLSARTLLPFATDPVSDVQFVIGEAHAGRDEYGRQVKRSPVKREDFDAWTKAALFLHDAQDGAIISTEDGDLLTDSQLRGHIYLKRLLLHVSTPTRSASITGKPLRFGYNFASGRTNRERQSVAGADEEARAILAIWSRVLAARPEVASELSDMLNTTEPQYADVSGAKRHMNVETACRLEKYLIGDQFAGTWYYCGEDKKNPRHDQIIQGLGCRGVELTSAYWAILRQDNLILTAEEEEYRRFRAVPPLTTGEDGSPFASDVRWLLCACVLACPKTNGIAINFVQAGQLHLQLFYSESEQTFRVHDRWFSRNDATGELGLPDDISSTDVLLHTVKRLFADALEQLPLDTFIEKDSPRSAEWHRRLEISQSFDTSVEIQCHRADCDHIDDDLLTAEDFRTDRMSCIGLRDEEGSEDGSRDNAQLPTCRSYRYDCSTGEHCECDLGEDEECVFVLLTPADPGSFVTISQNTRVVRSLSSSPPTSITSSPTLDSGRETACQTAEMCVSPGPEPQSPRDTFLRVAGADVGHEVGERVSPSPSRELELQSINGDSPTAEILLAVPCAYTGFRVALGPRLRNLDILSIDREQWYEGRSSENVQAVIGILNGKRFLLEGGPRKRPRQD